MSAKTKGSDRYKIGGKWLASSVAEVAKFFGRSRELVQREWRPHWGPECFAGDKYDLAAIAKWALARHKSPNDELAGLNRKKKELESARLEQQITAERRKNLEAEGLLLDRESAESQAKSAVRHLRDVFLRIPSGLIPLWGENGPAIADELRQRMEVACNEFSDRMIVNGHS